jgi:hypothetical protein
MELSIGMSQEGIKDTPELSRNYGSSSVHAGDLRESTISLFVYIYIHGQPLHIELSIDMPREEIKGISKIQKQILLLLGVWGGPSRFLKQRVSPEKGTFYFIFLIHRGLTYLDSTENDSSMP